MRLYQINYKKLVALLLPTVLRKSLIVVLLQCATTGVRMRHSDFTKERDKHLYRIRHTGQVCYLRAVLNDAFPDRTCDFQIEDSPSTSELVYAMSEIEFPYDQLRIPSEESDYTPVHVWSEDYILIETTPFVVGCPPEVFADTDSMNRVRYLVNRYKLLSKKAVYSSI